jgi:surface carbohydrate biosynthesis protein
MLCFNNSVAKKYSEYIYGKALVVGSFKNNLIPINNNKNNNNVLFISQFRNRKSDSGIVFYNSGKPIYWDDFYSAEKIILPILYNFCKKKNLNLLICGCSTDNELTEINFYKQILNSGDLNYIPRKSNFSAYEAVDNETYVVTIDSTLGYEAIARNKRVAFITIRGELCEIDGVDFSWPNHISKKGPYWTNGYSIDEVERVLNYIIQSSDETWNNEKKLAINNILYHDNNNYIFKKLINTILEK